MHLALVQLDTVWLDKEANYAKWRALTAHVSPGSLIVLPEMADVGFTMRSQAAGAGDSAAAVVELARQRGCYVAAGIVVRDGSVCRNTCLTAGPDGEIARYVQRHPFVLVKEGLSYAPGTEVVVADLAGTMLGPSICFDLRHPHVQREAALAGAEVLVNVANWPEARINHWKALLVARAIENQAYMIGCNRCGRDPYVAYPGQSVVVDPLGEIVVEAGEEESVLEAEIDVERVRQLRRDMPFLRS